MRGDGTFHFVYSGPNGLGIGVFSVRDGSLQGCDVAGGLYNGVVSDGGTDRLKVVIAMRVPSGVPLVSGTSPQELPYIKMIDIEIPDDYGDGTPVESNVAPAKVTVMIKRVPDEFGVLASGFFGRDGKGGAEWLSRCRRAVSSRPGC